MDAQGPGGVGGVEKQEQAICVVGFLSEIPLCVFYLGMVFCNELVQSASEMSYSTFRYEFLPSLEFFAGNLCRSYRTFRNQG